MAGRMVRVVPTNPVDGKDVIVFAVADLERGDARMTGRDREHHQVHVELDDRDVVVDRIGRRMDRGISATLAGGRPIPIFTSASRIEVKC